jgi:hypothetical protein
LQQRNAMAVPILTRPFADVLDRILSYYQTTEPMPRIVIDHPLQNIDDAALAERARQIAGAVELLLEGVG